MIGGLVVVVALLTFVGQQIATGAQDLADQVVDGLEQIRDWLRDGPLNASDSQINGWIEEAQESITENSKNGEVVGRVTEVGTAVGHVVAGLFIVLFATYFFLADGDRIWAWLVRLFPRAARERVDSSGRVAWVSLTQFVRATVLVALADAIGIMIVRRRPRGAVRPADRRAGLPRRVRPDGRRHGRRVGRRAGRAGRPGAVHRAAHARRRDRWSSRSRATSSSRS